MPVRVVAEMVLVPENLMSASNMSSARVGSSVSMRGFFNQSVEDVTL